MTTPHDENLSHDPAQAGEVGPQGAVPGHDVASGGGVSASPETAPHQVAGQHRTGSEGRGERVATAVDEVDSPLQPGRPVVLVPTPPGFWPLLLGVAVAALGPLFGFLWGGARGAGAGDTDFNPIYLGLFLGILVGAAGVALALMGGIRLYRHYHAADVAEQTV